MQSEMLCIITFIQDYPGICTLLKQLDNIPFKTQPEIRTMRCTNWLCWRLAFLPQWAENISIHAAKILYTLHLTFLAF